MTAVVSLVATGCNDAPPLVQTPHVMLGAAGEARFDRVPERLRTPDIPIVYFTDRADEAEPDSDRPVYGSARSGDYGFGVARIALSPGPTWDELVAATTSTDRSQRYRLAVADVEKHGEIGALGSRLTVRAGQLFYPPASETLFEADVARFHATLEPWLEPGDDNAALVFVHGFNNTFDDAAIRLAQTWHVAGREAVPVLFTWPAGFDAFKPLAYNRDRESGEFSVHPLKTLLMILAMHPRIERVHLVAHSRGTDVVVTALREIGAELRVVAGGTVFSKLALGVPLDEPIAFDPPARSPAETLKLDTLILASPDIDVEVFAQRFLIERGLEAADRMVVYSSRDDFAIKIARLFFAGGVRLGALRMEDVPPPTRRMIGRLSSLEMIECEVESDDSHAYLFEHPGALSDMIRVVRDDRPIGAEHGRPLVERGPGFWLLGDDYLAPAGAE